MMPPPFEVLRNSSDFSPNIHFFIESVNKKILGIARKRLYFWRGLRIYQGNAMGNRSRMVSKGPLIRILVIGKTKAPYLEEGIEDYLRRIQRYVRAEILTLKRPSHGAHQRREESRRLLERIHPGDYCVALDASGEPLSSEEFAALLEQKLMRESRCVTFVVGGELGLEPFLLQEMDRILSLSRMTFTHDMTRLILLEQIYRALTIIRGEKYHK